MVTTSWAVPVTQILVARVLRVRKSLSFFNTHATAIIYIKDGKGVAAANGIPVYPKGNVSLNVIEDGDTTKQDWWAIASAAATLVVFEGIEVP